MNFFIFIRAYLNVCLETNLCLADEIAPEKFTMREQSKSIKFSRNFIVKLVIFFPLQTAR